MSRLLIIGASRGVGAAFGLGVPQAGDDVWLLSRSRPYYLEQQDGVRRTWIEADVTDNACAAVVQAALGDTPLDAVIYNTGIWEDSAFTNHYRVEAVSAAENDHVLNVNLNGVIRVLPSLLPSLRRAPNPKIILIGSTSGLDNSSGVEVAYAASKFGLRGVAHALRENVRADGIAVTCINPGTISTQVTYEQDVAAALASDPAAIPVHDLVALVKCLLALSRGSCVKEIDMPAMGDTNA